MGKLQDHIKDQMSSTANIPALGDHRDLVESRWKQLRGFGLAESSPGKLSPGSLAMKNDFFGDDQKRLNAPLLKNFKKKFAGYMQSLTNASDRLNEVQREECILCSKKSVLKFWIYVSACSAIFSQNLNLPPICLLFWL